MIIDDCCHTCARRALGCRDECPDWAAHEAKKATIYAEREKTYAVADMRARSNGRKLAGRNVLRRICKE